MNYSLQELTWISHQHTNAITAAIFMKGRFGAFSSYITRILHVLIVYIDVIARIVLTTSAMLYEPCHDNVSPGVATS